MIRLDAATVLLQWATGGLLFLWVTTRRRQVGIGYGWLLRGVYGVMALGALAAGLGVGDPVPVREACSGVVALATFVALAVSVVRRRAGVSGERAREERRRSCLQTLELVDPAECREGETGLIAPEIFLWFRDQCRTDF